MQIILNALFVMAALFTNCALSRINFKDTTEITSHTDGIENKNFEFMVNHVSAGTHIFTLYENNRKNKIIGLVGELENTISDFKLDFEEVPNAVISSVSEPKIFFMFIFGILVIIRILKHKFKN